MTLSRMFGEECVVENVYQECFKECIPKIRDLQNNHVAC